MIGYTIVARRHRLPDEIPCVYRPFAESGEVFRWTDEVKANLEDYNRLDLGTWPPPNLPIEPRPRERVEPIHVIFEDNSLPRRPTAKNSLLLFKKHGDLIECKR